MEAARVARAVAGSTRQNGNEVAQGRKSTARTSSPPGPAETSEVSDSLSFEGALGELEATVERLEAGEMPLEEALTLFERGVNLSRQCSSTLESAERRIGILVAGREGELAEPFEMDGLDEDEDEDDDEFED